MPVSWGDLESILQLATTLNIGFSTVLSFQDAGIIKEKSSIDAILSSIEQMKTSSDFSENKRHAFAQKELEINEILLRYEKRIRPLNNNCLKYTFYWISILSFTLLCYASLHSSAPAGRFSVFSIGLNLPVFVIAAWIAWVSGNYVKKMQQKKAEIVRVATPG